MKKLLCLLSLLVYFTGCNSGGNQSNVVTNKNNYKGKKVLIAQSYHKEQLWEGTIDRVIHEGLEPLGMEVETIWMDTKKNQEKEYKHQAGLRVKKIVEEWNPDVLVIGDDNAFQEVAQKHFKNAEIPIVFFGLNWGGKRYGGPYSNTCGITEVRLLRQLIEHAKPYAKGTRVSHMIGVPNTKLGVRPFDKEFKQAFGISVKDHWKVADYKYEQARSFEEWKRKFLDMQKQYDIFIHSNSELIEDWDPEMARKLIYDNINIPIVGVDKQVEDQVLIGLMISFNEPGEFVVDSVKKIISGTKPSEIGVVFNKEGQLILNFDLADKLGITFSPNLIKNADKIIGEKKI